ncbi:MAG: site-specific integrase [Syntrophobacter sp.]
MKGSIQPHERGYWVICWYHKGKPERFYNDFLHGGGKFFRRHEDPLKCIGYEMANRCLTVMRNDWEAYQRGERAFDIEKYRHRYTDVIPYLETWLRTKEGTIMPGTLKPYSIAISKHLVPFFERHPVQLHEIQKDTIKLLMSELTCAPKTKRNIVNVLHACLSDACESNRIPKMPGFPKKGDYQITKKPITWITKAEQDKIFSFIPDPHLPIFLFLRLSWRREGEAIALLRSDYDARVDALIIHRGISDRKIVEKTKDGEIHVWPVTEQFRPHLKGLLTRADTSPYLFTCSSSRMEGKRYTREILMKVWTNACAKAKIKIDIHRGLRTSGASSFINECGGTIEEAQERGQWSNRETLKNFYGRYDIERLRELQEKGGVVPFKKVNTNDF